MYFIATMNEQKCTGETNKLNLSCNTLYSINALLVLACDNVILYYLNDYRNLITNQTTRKRKRVLPIPSIISNDVL